MNVKISEFSKPEGTSSFVIPKLNALKISKKSKLEGNLSFVIPKLKGSVIGENKNSEGNSFFIPKLSFSATDVNNEKDLITKLKPCSSSSNTSTEYSNLSELVSSHLSPLKTNESQISVNTDNCKTKINNKLPSYKLNTVDYNELKSQYYKENLGNNTWNIDLSIALKDIDSAPSIKKSKQFEQFDLPFIDCEIAPQRYSSTECKMDISPIIRQYHRLRKSPSKFGKILGLKYKRKSTYRVKRQNQFEATTTLFDFDTPSPDDLIQVHLRRK